MATFINKKKTFNGVYGIARYGISLYGTGTVGSGFFINKDKN